MRLARGLLSLVLIGASLPAAAQLREGVYELAGKTPEGGTYDGAVALRAAPGGAWVVVWQVGGARIVGLGLLHGGVLAVSFAVGGNPGVAAFDVDATGRLQGSWTTGTGFGTEVLTPRKPPAR